MLKMFVIVISLLTNGPEIIQVGRYMTLEECQAQAKIIVGQTQKARGRSGGVEAHCTPYWVEGNSAAISVDNPVDRGFRQQ